MAICKQASLCGLPSMARALFASGTQAQAPLLTSLSFHIPLAMFSQRAINLILAVGIGVGTGVYVFQPLLKEYEA